MMVELNKIYKGMPDAPMKIDENFTNLGMQANLSAGELVFTGAKYPNSETLTMSIPLSMCRNGWILTFTRYVDGAIATSGQRHFTKHISKYDIKNQSHVLNIQNDLGANANKLIFITDSTIMGSDTNATAPNNTYVLSRVVTY